MISEKFLKKLGIIYNKSFLNRINPDAYLFLENIKRVYTRILPKKRNTIIDCYLKALNWIKVNSIKNEGIILSFKRQVSYPEITGYLIPTLVEAGEQNLVKNYAKYLSEVQQISGAFLGPDGKEYVFDTGQALKGLLIASHYWPEFKQYARKAADYIIASTEDDGHMLSIYPEHIPEHIHVFVLPALLNAAEIFNDPKYRESAKKSLMYYKKTPDVLNPNYLTHFLAYIIDGFIDMNEGHFVGPVVRRIFLKQKKDGSIPAYPNVKWICSTGLAQFAIIGYKLGMIKEANRAVNYLCKIQNPSGGFFGSQGLYADYFNLDEISWANKFFIDAIHLKVSTFFDYHAHAFPIEISKQDGRLEAVIEYLGPLENKKILDAGCGKGRFAVKIKELFPSCEIHGVDISERLLEEVPDNIPKKKGSILNLPYESEAFDGLYCIEVLEHSMRTVKAIKELCRVVKKGGRITIIDKNIEKLGRLKITDFEQWFDKKRVADILKNHCRDVRVKEIRYDKYDADGLFLAWTGTIDMHV